MNELTSLKKMLFDGPNQPITDINLWAGSRQTSIEDAAKAIRVALTDMEEGKCIPVPLDY